VDGEVIHLPRALCPLGEDDQRVQGEHVEFPKDPPPKPHQSEVFDATIRFLKQGQSGIVCAYTGFGKTVLGFHAAYQMQVKTMVVTTKEDIYLQWLDGAQKFLGLEPHEVGEIRGDKCEVVGTKFVVAMIQSLSKEGRYPDWIGQDFGLIIFDEVHRVPADQFSAVVDMFPAKLRLGFSATPHRSDGKETLIFAHIGPIRVQTQAQLLIPKVLRFTSAWQCPRVMRPNQETGERDLVRIPHEPGKTTHIEKMLAADPARNHLVAELIHNAFIKGRKIVVFSTLHDHLKAIHRLCIKDFGMSGKDLGFYIGASTVAEKARREKEKIKPVLLTTYTMMGEGTSIDWLDTCILAIPRSKVEQPIGRIMREYPDKKTCVVMDIIDLDSPVFTAYASSRHRWYSEIGANVIDIA
jgi:superfamily II DNA or RNA helicase